MYIEGIGDEVFSFFLCLLAVFIIYLGWMSTRVREQRALGVFYYQTTTTTTTSNSNNNNSQRMSIPNASGSLQRSESQQSNRTETEEITDVVNNVIEELENDISNFVSGTGIGGGGSGGDTGSSSEDDNNRERGRGDDRAEESILQRMDQTDGPEREGARVHEEDDNDKEKKPPTAAIVATSDEKEMTIKLKYINDDMKMVTGRLSEGIGEFKRRTFSVELAAQKLIKLVFNGQVLEPEAKTLKECGLFDQCVVHCLVLNRRVPPASDTPNDTNAANTNENMSANTFATPSVGAGTGGGGGDPSGRPCIYIGVALLCSSLLIMWTARYQYASYFSFNSTVGLILMSIVFAAMIPLLILMERGVQV